MSQSINHQGYARLVTALLVLWFVTVLSASALHVFEAGKITTTAPLPLGLAVVLPILIFVVWLSVSRPFREFVLSRDIRALTLLQAWRVGGFTFLVLAAHGILPAIFARTAGWGDITVGATAPFVAKYLLDARWRNGFIAWQLVGMLDLVTAVTLGVLSSPTRIGILAHGVDTAAMSALPLSLIPTFAVPLLFIFHIICITQAVREVQVGTGEERRLHSVAS